jgi:hypothetical protein
LKTTSPGEGREDIPDDLLRARLVTTEQVLEINNRAKQFGWATVSAERLARRLDPADRHCLYPMLRIGGRGHALGCRCYLWFKERNQNSRTLVLMDVEDDTLQSFPEITGPHLHLLVGMLLGEISLEVIGIGSFHPLPADN